MPQRGRFPKRWWDWWRLAAVVVLVVGVTSAASWLPSHVACADGFPSAALRSDHGDCVGVSDTAYAFGRPDELGPVIGKIDEQNRAVRAKQVVCPTASTVTLAVLTPLGSAGVGGRSAHELEGIAAAQARINNTDCLHPILVEIANMGSTEQAAVDVAQQLKDDPDVTAVVGMGLSQKESADAADLLGSEPDPVPMVSDVITAQGFDAIGSQGRPEDFTRCTNKYPDGVGHGHLHRVAYGNAAQIDALTGQLGGRRPDFVLTPIDDADPYTCTSLSLVQDHFKGGVPEVKFDPKELSTVSTAVGRICGTKGPVTVLYTARSIDLGRFVQAVDIARQNDTCPYPVSLLSLSDANRLLAAEADSGLEKIRQSALTSNTFVTGRFTVVYSAFNNPDPPMPGNPPQGLLDQMRSSGFDVGDLADGWAVNAYDSVGVVDQVARGVSTATAVTRRGIDAALSNAKPVTGAGGRISFDQNGVRTGEPQLLRLCPAPAGKLVTSVPVDRGTCP